MPVCLAQNVNKKVEVLEKPDPQMQFAQMFVNKIVWDNAQCMAFSPNATNSKRQGCSPSFVRKRAALDRNDR